MKKQHIEGHNGGDLLIRDYGKDVDSHRLITITMLDHLDRVSEVTVRVEELLAAIIRATKAALKESEAP